MHVEKSDAMYTVFFLFLFLSFVTHSPFSFHPVFYLAFLFAHQINNELPLFSLCVLHTVLWGIMAGS